MGRQTGVIRIQGTVGGVTFDRDGFVRQAVGPREVTSARTRENNQEFGIAAQQGKVIRDALSSLDVGDRYLTSRMLQRVRSGIALDQTNRRGQRVLSANEAQQVLPGFELNRRSNLASVAAMNISVEGGQLLVEKFDGGEFVSSDFYQPSGTTDIQMVAVVSTVDISPNRLRVENVTSYQSELGVSLNLPKIPFVAPAAGGPDSDVINLAALSVRFYQEVNGEYYRLNDGSHDVGRIVAVAIPAAPVDGN